MRVLAYGVHGTLSYSVMRRVAQALASRGAEVRWEFAQSHMVSPKETERTIEREGLQLAARDFQPHVAIHADPRCSPRHWRCPIIEVPHGLASKIGYYLPPDQIKMEVDYHLAASDWYARRVADWFPSVRCVPAGMPKLDGYFEGDRTNDHVLFAPTFTKSLTSWPELRDVAGELARNDKVIVRVHRAQREMIETNYPDTVEVDDSLDICAAFKRARVVVSDISSAWIEAMGLGLPVVCFLTPGSDAHLNRKPQSTEAVFLPYATVIRKPNDLWAALQVARPAPKQIQEQILSYRGVSAARAADAIMGVIHGR